MKDQKRLNPKDDITNSLADLEPGQEVGGCQIEELLGYGGMAVVYRATQLSLNRSVALKILPRELAKKSMFVSRFDVESAALANLNHPNIVSIIDRGKDGDIYYFVMEYVDGPTLKDILSDDERPPVDECLKIVMQMCDALAYAHKKGIIHRDIKPGNVIINREGNVKIADFGLAQLTMSDSENKDITQTNAAMGTLKYMAPEQQVNAKGVDGRADLYSTGVVLYEMLTSRLPIGKFEMPSKINKGIDGRLDWIIEKSLRTDPQDRFQDPTEMSTAVHDIYNILFRDESDSSTRSKTPGDCPECGVNNPVDLRKCGRCGADLSELFEKCFNCDQENRIDISVCPECNCNLAEERRRRKREMDERQARIKELYEQRKYDEALSELDVILKTEDKQFKATREAAKSLVDRARHRKETLQRQTYDKGKRLYANHKYESAIETWSTLPQDIFNVAKRAEAAKNAIAERDGFLRSGDECVAKGDFRGGIAAWEKALKLSPDNEELKEKVTQARNKLGAENMVRVFLDEAKSLLSQGNFVDAVSACNKALEMNPDLPEVEEILKEIDRQEEQEDIYRRIKMGEASFRENNYEEAINAWAQALNICGDNASLKRQIEEQIQLAESRRSQRTFVRVVLPTIAVLVLVLVIVLLLLFVF